MSARAALDVPPRVVSIEEAARYAGFPGDVRAFKRWAESLGLAPLRPGNRKWPPAYDLRRVDEAIEAASGGPPAPERRVDW